MAVRRIKPNILSDDFAASRAFYNDVIGLDGGDGLDWILFFGTDKPEAQTPTSALEAAASPANPAPADRSACTGTLDLPVQDGELVPKHGDFHIPRISALTSHLPVPHATSYTRSNGAREETTRPILCTPGQSTVDWAASSSGSGPYAVLS